MVGAILCNCGCAMCTWCAGIRCSAGNNKPVKKDCRGNCTVSINFGLFDQSLGDLQIGFFDIGPGESPCLTAIGGTLPDPSIDPNISFVPKQRAFGDIEGTITCEWSVGYTNADSIFYHERTCFDTDPPSVLLDVITNNRDRWIYRQEAFVGIGEISGEFAETVAPDLPEGVDRDDPEDQANWRLITAYAIVDGTYTHRDTLTNQDCVWHFPTNDTSKMGIYFFSYKYVQVSEICAGNTIELENMNPSGVPDVAPLNTFIPLEESYHGTMDVLFNPDVPDNAHLATDLSPAYEITFYVCKRDGEDDLSYTRTVTVYQNAYPDSRAWTGASGDGEASLDLFRFGQQLQYNENAPGDGDETLFIIAAEIDGEGFDEILIDIGSEFLVPIGRRVEIYTDEGEGFTVQVKVEAAEGTSPHGTPCPE